MFVWAGKDVANSESAGKIYLPHGPATGHLIKRSGTQKYCFVF